MNNDKKKGDNDNRNLKFYAVYFVAILIMVTVFNYFMNDIRNKRQYYNEFYAALEADRIAEITVDESQRIYTYTMKEGDELAGLQLYTGMVTGDEEVLSLIKEKKVDIYSKPVETASPLMTLLFSWVLPLGLLLFLGSYLMKNMEKRGGSMMSFGKNTAKLYESDTGVTFKDVAGQEEAKESLIEIVDFLHNPQKYVDIGARLPKGALLVGPPGTGKTLLAKAVAGEAKVPFFSLSGSAFVEMFVGMGAARVRDLFKEAMTKAPCIIFIDEIDAIGKSRETGGLPGGNDEREQTLNQLLAEMDGFDSSKGIVLLAATNRPEVLDKALLRPGRFDRRIIVDAPDLKGREAILRVHSKDVKMGEDVNLNEIAKGTPGAVGADLANMINEAALRAVKNGRKFVMQEDLQESIEVVIAGQQKKDRIMSANEKRIVAFHEIGHALVAAMQKGTDPVIKITIIPRTMGSLGYTMQVPEDEKYLMSKDEMLKEIAILFGGRSAEEVEFGSITTGASNDIERATQLARRMVSMYGMSETFDMMALESIRGQYLDGRAVLNVSDETATKIDEETLKLIKAGHKTALDILSGNRELLTVLSEKLLEKETMTGEEFMEVVREFKGESFGRKEVTAPTVEVQAEETAQETQPEDQVNELDEMRYAITEDLEGDSGDE
ncbi:ATP-dependent zinc metalloprotease FtsH [Youngiibacter multivorans]|uniref:ATP-dependent zinc metalloprotease FtsH n=1 Tax=Youngiibacter multivorans TaxID=937251 RepID=A0ABS4G891_9CLOT|nr:cell division protease FtsH [Youngiibacter multivorans]